MKKKNLKGLPENLARSYLSTHSYYQKGYSGDWIYHLANKYDIDEVEINILTKAISPNSMQHSALLNDLDKMNSIIQKQLEINGFNKGYVIEAIFNFKIDNYSSNNYRSITCYPYIKLQDGTQYEPKHPIKEQVWTFDELNKVKNPWLLKTNK